MEASATSHIVARTVQSRFHNHAHEVVDPSIQQIQSPFLLFAVEESEGELARSGSNDLDASLVDDDWKD